MESLLHKTDLPMLAKTFFGLEEELAKELKKLGAKDVEIHTRSVSFKGDLGFLYKVNYNCRLALSILLILDKFKATNQDELYHNVKKLKWDPFINKGQTLAVKCSLNSQYFNNSLFVAQKTKDAIVDQLKELWGHRPSVNTQNPDLLVDVHLFKDNCTVSVSSSGQPLFKRGYRQNSEEAPLNEVLAAGLVKLSGWDEIAHFVDPMCGSGTIAIEAAMIAGNIPPGYFRKGFAFKTWSSFDEELWKLIRDNSIEKIQEQRCKIFASDISSKAISIAKSNAFEAKVDDSISFKKCSIQELQPEKGRGVAIINPPYGERLLSGEALNDFYKEIGDALKKSFAGYNVWLLTSNMEAAKYIGLRPSRKIKLFNGPLECKFLKFEMYEGTKKLHKLNKEDADE